MDGKGVLSPNFRIEVAIFDGFAVEKQSGDTGEQDEGPQNEYQPPPGFTQQKR